MAQLWRRPPRLPLDQLRTFALRCAEGLGEAGVSMAAELLDVARRYLSGSATVDDLGGRASQDASAVAQGGVRAPRCSTLCAALARAGTPRGSPCAHRPTWTVRVCRASDAFVVLLEHALAPGTGPRTEVSPGAKTAPRVFQAAPGSGRRRHGGRPAAPGRPAPGVPAEALLASNPRRVFFGAVDPSGHEPVLYC